MPKDILKTAKLHFVAGKGGVGKTLISQALATYFAENSKTLLVELSEEESGEENSESFPREVAPNLSHVKIFPDQALNEYLRLKIPQKLINSLLSKSLFRALGSAMPGLSDLTRLGKIWYHCEQFEKIVVDMPSSGFVSRFLSIASVVKEAVKIGPMAKEAQVMDEFLKDENLARLHLVALPEEMVVNETLELYQEVKKRASVACGYLMLNRVLDLDLKSLEVDLSRFPESAAIIESFKKRKLLEDLERRRLYLRGMHLPEVVFFDQMGEMMDSKIISMMVKTLAKEGPE